MTPSTTELLNVTGKTGTFDGAWFTVHNDYKPQVPVVVSLKAGTATIVVEGRNSPNDTAVQVSTGTATRNELDTRFRQMRARLTGATAASVVVSVDTLLRP